MSEMCHKHRYLDLHTGDRDHESKGTPVDDQTESTNHQPSEDEPLITQFNDRPYRIEQQICGKTAKAT